MPTLKINGQELTVDQGTTIIEAAKKIGVDIPVFCYHEGLSIAANCRMCLVDVELNGRKFPNPLPACHTMVGEGMVVETETPKVKKIRKGVLEFLLLNHPIDCPICDQAGECSLQDHYMEHGHYESRQEFEKVKKNKATPIGKNVILDSERCILCSRCVRFTNEVTKTDEMIISNRGNHSEIGVFPGKTLDNDYSLCTVDICPVGALTSRDFRFKKREWDLTKTNSICTGCSKGCNISLEYEGNVIYRITPVENQEVNKWWMCDYGRSIKDEINDNRITKSLINKEEKPFEDTLKSLVDLLLSYEKKENKVAIIINAHNSTENAYAIKYFFSKYFNMTNFYIGTQKDGDSDSLLIKSDKNPNRKGVNLVIGDNLKDDLSKDLSKYELVIQFGSELIETFDESKFKNIKKFVVFATNKNSVTDLASMIIPIKSHAEQTGTFINEDSRMQRFFAMVNNKTYMPTAKGVAQIKNDRENLLETYKIISQISKLSGFDLRFETIFDIMNLMKKELKPFGDFKYSSLGKTGLIIEGL
jgi:NADH-quinone oxidoreductase subunit G